MTSWEFASLPFWGFGLTFATVAAAIMSKRTTPDKLNDRIGTAGVALVFGAPFLILAAWMWH